MVTVWLNSWETKDSKNAFRQTEDELISRKIFLIFYMKLNVVGIPELKNCSQKQNNNNNNSFGVICLNKGKHELLIDDTFMKNHRA